jgi:hypothetical protein
VTQPLTRSRIPLRGVTAIVLAAAVALAELALFALFMMPLFPLVPVFVLVMLGNALVLSSVVSWATSLARPEPLRVRDGEAAPATRAPESRTPAHAA